MLRCGYNGLILRLYSIGPLAARTPGEIVSTVIEKITNLSTSSQIDVSVPNTALRTLVAALPQPQSASATSQDVKDAYSAVSKVLIPRLIGQAVLPSQRPPPSTAPGLLAMHKDKSYSSDAVDVMVEVVRCYGPLLQEPELAALAKCVMAIIQSPTAGGVVKKRALVGIGALVVHFSDMQLNQFVSSLIEDFRSPHRTPTHRRYLIATAGTLARATPHKFGPYLKILAPFVLSAVSQAELDELRTASDDEAETDPEIEELRETALVSLDAVLGACFAEMQPFLEESVAAALRYLKYDPNVAETEDEDMSGIQDAGSDDGITEEPVDDDDEYAELDDEDAFSDVDDLSWKIRRCATKVLYTIISNSSKDEYGVLFEKLGPALVSRISNEREENVRLEVLSATTALVKKTAASTGFLSAPLANGQGDQLPTSNSRKRRRQDSFPTLDDTDLKDFLHPRASPPVRLTSPLAGPQTDLASLTPKIVQSISKLWKKGSLSFKQAATILLRSIAQARNGALADRLQQIEDLAADALKPSTLHLTPTGSTSGSSATAVSLQIEALSLISVLTETNPTTAVVPFVIALIPAVISTVHDRNFKVSSEGLAAVEQFVKALTPPRLLAANHDHAIHLEKLHNTVVDRVVDKNADLEVRSRAIQVFGVLLARTSSTKLLDQKDRTEGLGLLSDCLKFETTRLPSARAIGVVGAAASPLDDVGSAWVREVSLELGAQLRKADRALRGSCLEALQYLALNPVTAAQYDTHTIQELEVLLEPLLTQHDLHLLTPALVIFAKIIPTSPESLVNEKFVQSLCDLAHARLEGSPLRAFLLVVKVIGEQGVGSRLMKGLLAVGTSGETLVVGRGIGTLIVFGGQNVGVTVEDFLKEIDSTTHINAICLALTVLGEVGFRTGDQSPLGLDIFMDNMSVQSDKVRLAAALALGSASASNIAKSLPIILRNLSVSPSQDYLYLHALKEVLQHSDQTAKEIAPFASELWQKLFAVSEAEANRAVGAECIGRLALIDPPTYIPELQRSLEDSKASIRGTVISAFRFTLADSSSSYNLLLAKTIAPMLKMMLGDSDINNRRLAVTTLNAAIHNKPELVLADLGQLLPIVLADSYVKPELIKTISIGPFKHKEDSGLDLRKSAYATMYALLDTPMTLPYLSIPTIFDRILDGITDDHDVRTLCNLMLGRLTTINPDETRRRLNALAEKFKIVLGQKVKENAVKQEIEKVNEANAGVIRATLELDRHFPNAVAEGSGEMMAWKGYLEFVKREFAPTVRGIQSEVI